MKTWNTSHFPWRMVLSQLPSVPNLEDSQLQEYVMAVSRQNILQKAPFQLNIVMYITSLIYVDIVDSRQQKNVLLNRHLLLSKYQVDFWTIILPHHLQRFLQIKAQKTHSFVHIIVHSLQHQTRRKSFSNKYWKCS